MGIVSSRVGHQSLWRCTHNQLTQVLLFRSLISLGTLIALLILPTPSLTHRDISTSLTSYWSMGLGELRDYTFIYVSFPRDDPWGLISNVILANAPQLMASAFYLLYNAILTTFLVQSEFSNMHKSRKPLRVSEPVGTQRSSYPISLPFRYGIPLSVSSGVMSWLLSQSLFLARITALHPDGTLDRASSFSTTGYSPIAIFFGEQPRYTAQTPSLVLTHERFSSSSLFCSSHRCPCSWVSKARWANEPRLYQQPRDQRRMSCTPRRCERRLLVADKVGCCRSG